MRHVLGERLVEPEVVPPLHRHEVAEPHVRHLVARPCWPGSAARPRSRRRGRGTGRGSVTQPGFSIAPALNSGHEDLVVLPERVPDAEQRRGSSRTTASVTSKHLGRRAARAAPAARPAHGCRAGCRRARRARRRRVRRRPSRSTSRAAWSSRASTCPGAAGWRRRCRARSSRAGRVTRHVVGRLEVGLVEAGVDAGAASRKRWP